MNNANVNEDVLLTKITDVDPNNDVANLKYLSLLDHQAWVVLPCVLLVYVVLQSFMMIFASFTHDICNSQAEFPKWLDTISVGAAACFLFNAFLEVIKIFISLKSTNQRRNRSHMKLHFSLFILCTIAGSSQVLSIWKGSDGICFDALG
jgi:hypothetical protein